MKNLLTLLLGLMTIQSNAQQIALNFLGDNDWVVGTNTNLPQGNAPRTIETWIKYSTHRNDMSIFNYGNFAYNQKFTLHLYNGVYIIGEGNDLNTGYHFNDGNWHHLAVTHDGTTTRVYVDGIQRGSRNTTYNTTGFDFQMGVSLRNGNWDFRFEGTVDELRVWNVARTQQQIIDNMYSLLNAVPGLVASYHLNDGVPNSDNRHITTVVDASPSAAHGTLQNFALMGGSSNFVDDAIMILPVRLVEFNASAAQCNSSISWKTADERNMKAYTIEESRDGVRFSTAQQIAPKNIGGENFYTIALQAATGKTFYRLKMTDHDNSVSYSRTVLVNASGCGSGFSLQPNPARSELFIKTYATGSEYLIYSITGVLVKRDFITETVQRVDISKYPAGLYFVSVQGSEPLGFIKK